VKTRTDRTAGQISEQANGKTQGSETVNLSAPDLAPDRSDRFAAKSVRSVYPPPTTRQMSDRLQTIDIGQQNIKSVRSVQSVHVFTSSGTEVCAHCGQPGGLPVAFDDAEAVLHPGCRGAWLSAQDTGSQSTVAARCGVVVMTISLPNTHMTVGEFQQNNLVGSLVSAPAVMRGGNSVSGISIKQRRPQWWLNAKDAEIANALEGEYHVLDCDQEQFPFCGGQLISCGCYGSRGALFDLTPEQRKRWERKLNDKGRVPFILYPNMCAKCGKLWPEMFRVPDKEWMRYVEKGQRDKILCKPCYDQIRIWVDECRGTEIVKRHRHRSPSP
jgi:hypothetical protein